MYIGGGVQADDFVFKPKTCLVYWWKRTSWWWQASKVYVCSKQAAHVVLKPGTKFWSDNVTIDKESENTGWLVCVYVYEYVTKGKKVSKMFQMKKENTCCFVCSGFLSLCLFLLCTNILGWGGPRKLPWGKYSVCWFIEEYWICHALLPRLDWFSSEGLGFFEQELLWVH